MMSTESIKHYRLFRGCLNKRRKERVHGNHYGGRKLKSCSDDA